MNSSALSFDELISKGRVEIQRFLSPSLTGHLLNRVMSFDQGGALRPAGIRSAGEIVKSVRGDNIRWIEDWGPEPMKETKAVLMELGKALRSELRAPLKSFEAHFSRYGNGAFYKKHLDQHLGQKRRLITFVLYLNHCDGGELVIYKREKRGQIDVHIRPEAGKLVLFLSGEIFHEVLPSRSDRFGLTGWYRDDIDLQGNTNLEDL